jgi:hypothetical protein
MAMIETLQPQNFTYLLFYFHLSTTLCLLHIKYVYILNKGPLLRSLHEGTHNTLQQSKDIEDCVRQRVRRFKDHIDLVLQGRMR